MGYRRIYGPAFAKAVAVNVVDIASRLTIGWRPMDSTIQKTISDMIIVEADVIVTHYAGARYRRGGPERLGGPPPVVLVEDRDIEMLWASRGRQFSSDWFEQSAPAGSGGAQPSVSVHAAISTP